MPADLPDKLLSGEISTTTSPELNTQLHPREDVVSTNFSTENASNLAETDSNVAKLTEQDIEDLVKIQAELYHLASSFPESTTEIINSTTATSSFSAADNFIDANAAISLPETVSGSILPNLEASTLLTVAQDELAQTAGLVDEGNNDFALTDSQFVSDVVVSTSMKEEEAGMSTTSQSFPADIPLNEDAEMIDQSVKSDSSVIFPSNEALVTEAIPMELQTASMDTTDQQSLDVEMNPPGLLSEVVSVSQPEQTSVLDTSVAFPTTIAIDPNSSNITVEAVLPTIVPKPATIQVTSTSTKVVSQTSVTTSAKTVSQTAPKSIPSQIQVPLKTTLVVSSSGQQLGTPKTMINVTAASTIRAGKQVYLVQKAGTSAGSSILAQTKTLTVNPTKMTPVLASTAGGSKLISVVPTSSNQTAVTVPFSALRGDLKVMLRDAQGGKIQTTTSGGISLNNFSFIQTGGGKVGAGGQILNKVKIVNAPPGTQFAQVSGGTQKPGGQQPTILLASPNKSLFAKGGGTQILRTIPGTLTKQGMVLLSPVKGGKLGSFTNLTLKSPTSIAPAPNSSGVGKTVAQTVMVSSGGSSQVVTLTTSNATTMSAGGVSMSPQKIILRPVAPLKAGTVINQGIKFAPTGSSSVRQIVPISGVLTATTGTAGMIQVPGSKFNYVRLITTPSSQGAGMKQSATLIPVSAIRTTSSNMATMVVSAGTKSDSILARPVTAITKTVTTTAKPIAALPSNLAKQVRLAIPVQSQSGAVAVKTGVQQRLIIPNSARSASTGTLAQFPSGSTIISGNASGGVGATSFVMVSAQYVAQLQQGQSNGAPRMVLQGTQNILPAPTSGGLLHTPGFVPIAAATPKAYDHQSGQPINSTSSTPMKQSNGKVVVETTESRPRKPCNCTKSQCLKLYCDCFANGEFCNSCNCTNCYNNLEHEEDRQKAIKSCLERNPMAFHPKIGKSRKGRDGDHERRHTKGCNCKRSGCLKNYCECYEAKILCTNLCKCNGCKNFEDSNERKTLMHLADAAEVRVQQQAAAKTKISSQIQDLPIRPTIISLTGERLPFSFITDEVTEATCDCLLARAEEGERLDYSISVIEKQILEEFGRCLVQVIECANKTRGN